MRVFDVWHPHGDERPGFPSLTGKQRVEVRALQTVPTPTSGHAGTAWPRFTASTDQQPSSAGPGYRPASLNIRLPPTGGGSPPGPERPGLRPRHNPMTGRSERGPWWSASSGEPRNQAAPLLSTQSAAANNARATDRACAVVRYSSWSADSHTPTSPWGFCTAATSAEKPSSPRRGGQCGPKWKVGPVSPSGCSVWHQLGQVVEVMPSILRQPQGHGQMGGMRPVRNEPNPWTSLATSPGISPGREKPPTYDKISTRLQKVLAVKRIRATSLRVVNPSGQLLFLELELDMPVSEAAIGCSREPSCVAKMS